MQNRKLAKKAQLGQWGVLVTIALVMVVFGMILTIGGEIQEDVKEDQVTNVASCGRNSTGGTGGTILYTLCPTSYDVGDAALTAQLELAQKQTSIVSAGVGIFILGLLIGGFALFRLF